MNNEATTRPRGASGEPVFHEPWVAHALALVVLLHERGLLTRREWAAALGAQITAALAAGDADLGDTYHRHWLDALEALVATGGAGSGEELACCRAAWRHAADRTPNEQPIALRSGDLAA